MRLKSKLVLAATCVTFAIVIVLSMLFMAELLRQRIAQTAASNDVMARQVLMMARQAVEVGLEANPPVDHSEEALHAAVADALRSHKPLRDTMNSLVRYSPAVQDVSVTDAAGWTLMSTDPQMWNQQATTRTSFARVRDAGIAEQIRNVFGKVRVLDVTVPLDRNGMPFLIVHMGVRTTFLKNNYVPWLRGASLLALLCGVISMVASGLMAHVALRPITEISRRLEQLTGAEEERIELAGIGLGMGLLDGGPDAVVRVTNTIDRLGRQMKTTEAVYTDLQTNLDHMLDTLRDGVVLFTAEWRAVMVSDAVAKFVGAEAAPLVGRTLSEIFLADSVLGKAVLAAFQRDENVTGERVWLEDGREVEISLDHINDGSLSEDRSYRSASGGTQGPSGKMGTLLTLRDAGSAIKLEQELDVSRRLAAVGRLTAGVGHEVKNPINAMVVHLELLRSKLQSAADGGSFPVGAQRHVDILAGEMERLDRVVQTLADFTRPMELHLQEIDLRDIARNVVDLTWAEMAEQSVEVRSVLETVKVRADGEMLRQAMLNLMLNGMQAMPKGGLLRVCTRREHDAAIIEIRDEGEGIAPELMPKIFNLYFTTKAKGSGIGLAMTYRIVQMHGGAMEVKSETGRGTVFTMRLPASAAMLPKTSIAYQIPVGRST